MEKDNAKETYVEFDTVCLLKKIVTQIRRLKSSFFSVSLSSCLLFLLALLGFSLPLLLSSLLDSKVLLSLCLSAFIFALFYRLIWCVFVFLVAFTYANWSLAQHQNLEKLLNLESANNKKIETSLVGNVIGLTNKKYKRTRFYFSVIQAPKDFGQLINKKLLLSCYYCPKEILAGQTWRLTVKLKPPNGYASWGAFDYEKYLFRKKVIATGYVKFKKNRIDQDMVLLPTQLSLNKRVADLRESIRSQLSDVLANKKNALAMISALTIGDKSLFDEGIRESFQATGVSHLMAISGLHIGLIFLLAQYLIGRVLTYFSPFLFHYIARQLIVLLPSLFVAAIYAALAGFAMPTLRALLMLSVYVILKLISREANILRVLLVSMLIILVVDSHAILDYGFWMSCSAVAVIGAMQLMYSKVNLIRLQIGLWLGMMPVNIILFDSVSLLSPIVNFIAVPLFSFFMIPLSLILVAFISLDWVAQILPFFAHLFEWVYVVLEYVSNLPIVLINITLPDLLVFVFGCLLWVLFRRHKYVVWLIFSSILLFFSLSFLDKNWIGRRESADEFRIVMFDVGQGLSILLHSKSYALLYDTGPKYSSGLSPANAVIRPYLARHHIDKLDMLVISHADQDHIGGLHDIQNSVPIEAILTSRVDKIKGAQECLNGQHWQVNGLLFEVISPDIHSPRGSNNQSCVIRVSTAYMSFLLSGDIEKEVESYLIENGRNIQSDVLFVPHQGSKTSSSDAFLDAVDPTYAMVAAGFQNHYQHPNSLVLERYKKRKIKLYSTIESGSILMKIRKSKIKIGAYKMSNKKFWHR